MRYPEIVTEATGPYVKKLIDPALLTFAEYYRLTNPQGKTHPSDAYDWSLDQMQQDYGKREEYPTLLNQIKLAGLKFEVRMKQEDRWQGRYLRTNPDGEPIRDQAGNLTYLTPEEVRETIPERYEYSVAIYNERGQRVATAQEEWGAWLFAVAREYRSLGLGTIVAKLAWKLHPDRSSGGYTPAGARNLRQVHRSFVRDYLASGMYSWLVRSGQLSGARAREIIASIGSKDEPGWRPGPRSNLASNDPANWLLYVGEYGDFVVYDKQLRESEDWPEHFRDQLVKGIAYVQVHERQEVWAMLRAFGGDSTPLRRFLLNCAIEYAQRENATLYLEGDEPDAVDPTMATLGPESMVRGFRSRKVIPTGKRFDYTGMGHAEAVWRRQFDRYDEFRIAMLEMAYAKYR